MSEITRENLNTETLEAINESELGECERCCTLKAISDTKDGKGMTRCATFEDYLKAVAK